MAEQSFLERSRYYLAEEYPAKIRLSVSPLSHELIWRRANADSNSIGNLLLHLSGNVRQWIISGIGGQPDNRERSTEFAATSGDTAQQLLARLDATVAEAGEVIGALSGTDLSRHLLIQGRETTVLGAVYHVVEHFSTHTGQIVLLAKMYAPGAVKFYEDAGGIAIPLWGGREGTPRS